MFLFPLFRHQDDRHCTRRSQTRRRPLVENLEGRQLLSTVASPDVSFNFTKISAIVGNHIGTNVSAIVGNHIGISPAVKGGHIGTSVSAIVGNHIGTGVA
jgi:hypothetical protein